MPVFKVLFLIALGLGSIYWLGQLVLALRVIKSVRLIPELGEQEPEHWPKVSEIMTACNEADTIEEAMRVRLEDDYPNLELILVEDRSSDNTPQIADQIAARDPRVKVVHLKELPAGWLGKLNAMNQGLKIATGDWILFSDADVKIRRGTMRRVIAYCESRPLDFLAALPELYPVGFLMDATFSVFVRIICPAARVWAIEDEKSKASAGAGAFNLVRRSALEKTQGLEWIKLEPADDVALGQMLKESGARCSLVNGRGYVGVYFYRSLREMAVGAERALFTSIGGFSFFRLLLMGAVVLALELAPLYALIPIGIPHLRVLGLVMLAIAVLTQILLNRWAGRKMLPSIFFPVGSIAIAVIAWRTGYLGWKRGGIYWRGTFYPTELLKQGSRYKLS